MGGWGFERPGELGVFLDEGLRELVDHLALVFGHGSRVMVHYHLHGAVAYLVHRFANGSAGH